MKRGIRQTNPIKRAERNARIRKYLTEHPGTPARALARMFKLSHQMILNILKDGHE